MPDISMCSNSKCLKRNACYRFRAIPSKFRQSYGRFPYDEKSGSCSHFDEVRKRDRLTDVDCKHIKKLGEGCTLNNKCTFPNCESKIKKLNY